MLALSLLRVFHWSSRETMLKTWTNHDQKIRQTQTQKIHEKPVESMTGGVARRRPLLWTNSLPRKQRRQENSYFSFIPWFVWQKTSVGRTFVPGWYFIAAFLKLYLLIILESDKCPTIQTSIHILAQISQQIWNCKREKNVNIDHWEWFFTIIFS